MRPVRRTKDEEAAEPEILKVGLSGLFPPRSLPLRDLDFVAAEEFLIDGSRVFSVGHPAGHIKEVTISHVTHGELLHESFERNRLDSPATHTTPQKVG